MRPTGWSELRGLTLGAGIGVDDVLVGGQVALDHGGVTGARAGRVLRRT